MRKKFKRLSQLYQKDRYAVENLQDTKGQKAFCVLTAYGIFIVYESRWESFLLAQEDFNSKSNVSHKAFDQLERFSRYSKAQIRTELKTS